MREINFNSFIIQILVLILSIYSSILIANGLGVYLRGELALYLVYSKVLVTFLSLFSSANNFLVDSFNEIDVLLYNFISIIIVSLFFICFCVFTDLNLNLTFAICLFFIVISSLETSARLIIFQKNLIKRINTVDIVTTILFALSLISFQKRLSINFILILYLFKQLILLISHSIVIDYSNSDFNIKKLISICKHNFNKNLKLSGITSILNQLLIKIDIIIVSVFFSKEILGVYSVGSNLVNGINSSSSILNKTFRTSKKSLEDDLIIARKLIIKILVIFGFGFIIFLVFGKKLIQLFFDKEYQNLYEILLVLSLSCFLYIIHQPIFGIIIKVKKFTFKLVRNFIISISVSLILLFLLSTFTYNIYYIPLALIISYLILLFLNIKHLKF